MDRAERRGLAQHLEQEVALERHEEILRPTASAINPRLHVMLHVVVANQLLADEPPETWQTAQRLAGLGYDWHNVMYLTMGPVSGCESDPGRTAAVRPRGLREGAGRTARRPADAR
jgi:hypothetical protein